MSFVICLLSVVPMRKEPSHRSEMVSQLLFGEYGTAGEEKEDFVFVKCDYDGYEGWVQKSQLTFIEDNVKQVTSIYTNNFTTTVIIDGALSHVPFGSPVFELKQLAFTIVGKQCRYLMQPQQMWNAVELEFNETTLQAVYQPFLNTPYLWGGRSVFGIDCSGFAQQIFKFFGIRLLRDAYLQAGQGSGVNSVAEARPGDLAFFQNEKGRITHVGIVLSGNKIVHAAGKVRIDTLDEKGIYKSESGKYSHAFHSIRRII